MKRRFTIGYLGMIALVCFGFEVCSIPEVWVKVALCIVDILAFLLDIEGEHKRIADGTLYIVPGEDDSHIALGLSIEALPEQLIQKDQAVLTIVNKMGGNDHGH